MIQFLIPSIKGAFKLWLKILRLMIPISIIVKILEMIGLITIFGKLLEPIMIFVGLPGLMGLVWAITIATNLWAGALLFVSLSGLIHVSMAQVTILGILMLMAHGLPIEIRMVQKCGVSAIFALVLRVASAIGLAYAFNHLFSAFKLLQAPATIMLGSSSISENNLFDWVLYQGKSYLFVLMMLLGLVLLLDLLKKYGLVHKLGTILAPYLSLIGVSKKCAPITLVGMTLGLVYGGVLLLKEIEIGELDSDDVLLSITSMNLFHSIIEDTIIIVLMGGSLFWVLPIRFIFTVVVMRFISFLMKDNKEIFYKIMRT
ncbi:MAG: hypothetical protein EPO11_09540 [Gammaproteobacteria bacterium]|nr:MAG: hypothetical protein EPO11_09540 [Gammaproteobacteria bacterium]